MVESMIIPETLLRQYNDIIQCFQTIIDIKYNEDNYTKNILLIDPITGQQYCIDKPSFERTIYDQFKTSDDKEIKAKFNEYNKTLGLKKVKLQDIVKLVQFIRYILSIYVSTDYSQDIGLLYENLQNDNQQSLQVLNKAELIEFDNLLKQRRNGDKKNDLTTQLATQQEILQQYEQKQQQLIIESEKLKEQLRQNEQEYLIILDSITEQQSKVSDLKQEIELIQNDYPQYQIEQKCRQYKGDIGNLSDLNKGLVKLQSEVQSILVNKVDEEDRKELIEQFQLGYAGNWQLTNLRDKYKENKWIILLIENCRIWYPLYIFEVYWLHFRDYVIKSNKKGARVYFLYIWVQSLGMYIIYYGLESGNVAIRSRYDNSHFKESLQPTDKKYKICNKYALEDYDQSTLSAFEKESLLHERFRHIWIVSEETLQYFYMQCKSDKQGRTRIGIWLDEIGDFDNDTKESLSQIEDFFIFMGIEADIDDCFKADLSPQPGSHGILTINKNNVKATASIRDIMPGIRSIRQKLIQYSLDHILPKYSESEQLLINLYRELVSDIINGTPSVPNKDRLIKHLLDANQRKLQLEPNNPIWFMQ